LNAERLKELLRDLGSYGYSGQMQQRPAPAEGGVLKRRWWQYYSIDPVTGQVLPPPQRIIQSWDTSLKAKTSSDWAVGTAWACHNADRPAFVGTNPSTPAARTSRHAALENGRTQPSAITDIGWGWPRRWR